jgi:hypothetical protein
LSPEYSYLPNQIINYSTEEKMITTPSPIDDKQSMIAFNSQIYDQLSNMEHLRKDERIIKLREAYDRPELVSVQSARHFKLSYASIVELINQLTSLQLDNTAYVKLSAFEKSRGRKAKDSLKNKSSLCFQPPAKKLASTSAVAEVTNVCQDQEYHCIQLQEWQTKEGMQNLQRCNG